MSVLEALDGWDYAALAGFGFPSISALHYRSFKRFGHGTYTYIYGREIKVHTYHGHL
jgi:hypothetical protein